MGPDEIIIAVEFTPDEEIFTSLKCANLSNSVYPIQREIIVNLIFRNSAIGLFCRGFGQSTKEQCHGGRPRVTCRNRSTLIVR